MHIAHKNISELQANMVADSPPATAISGPPTLKYADLFSKGGLDVGLWSSSVGSWRIEGWSGNEVMHILSGRVRLTADDGTVHNLSAGDIFVVTKGWTGIWETVEDMQKIYVILSADLAL